MIKEFQISNFKSFKKFQISNLSNINIFLGDNNVGKSSILEAIFGFACGGNLDPFVNNVILRGRRNSNLGKYDFMEKILNTFNDRSNPEIIFEAKEESGFKKKFIYKFKLSSEFKEIDPDLVIENIQNPKKNSNMVMNGSLVESIFLSRINVLEDKKQPISKDLTFPLQSHLLQGLPYKSANIRDFLTYKENRESAIIYSHLKRKSKIFSEFVKEIQNTFSDIEGIDMFPNPDGTPAPVSLKAKDKDYLPIYEYGEGIQRWFGIIGGMITNQKSIFCIEEIGATFHPKGQGNLGGNLSRMAKKYENQVFATAQSMEFIENFLLEIEEEKELLDQVRIITLKKVDGEIKSRVLNGSEALDLIINNEMELR